MSAPLRTVAPALWPTADQVQYERYVAELACFVTEILRSGASVTLFSSSPPDDQIFADLHKHLNVALDPTIRGELSASATSTVAELLDVLHTVDLVVASRLHGILLSFLSGKPAIAISYDRKVASLMDELGQALYCVDIRSFTGDDLMGLFSSLRMNSDVIQSATATICRQYNEVLQEQYRDITQLTRARRPNSLQRSPRVSSDEEPFADRTETGRLDLSPATDCSVAPATGAPGKTN